MAKKLNIDTNAIAEKESNVATVEVVRKKIAITDLVADPLNNEDVSYTADLEYSIRHIGFHGELDVTDFGMESGKYMIVSGHRRVEALKKLGYKEVPCVIHSFSSREDMVDFNQNMNNGTRDSSRDPYMLVDRYKGNYENLKNLYAKAGVKKSEKELTEEIAERFGLSTQHIERLKGLSHLIPSLAELIRQGRVGIFHLQPASALSEKEQEGLSKILVDLLDKMISEDEEAVLTRDTVKEIVKAYKAGEIKSCEDWLSRSFSGMNKPIEGDEDKPTVEPTEDNEAEPTVEPTEDNEAEPNEGDEDKPSGKKDKEEKSDEELKHERFNAIIKHAKKISDLLMEDYGAGSDEDCYAYVETVGEMIYDVIHQLKDVAESSTTDDAYKKYVEKMQNIKKLVGLKK